ncbi:pro-adrenomedullin [Liasis olivaceus]
MKVVLLALLYLGSVSFFGIDATKLDIASNFKKRWTAWALSRARRDLPARVADASVHSFIRTQDVKGESRTLQPSLETSRVRVKRHLQNLTGVRATCRLGTCNLQSLANTLFHLTDKDKDISAPPKKLSPLGYGRRRRSLAPRIGAGGQVWLSPQSTLMPIHVLPDLGRIKELLQLPH